MNGGVCVFFLLADLVRRSDVSEAGRPGGGNHHPHHSHRLPAEDPRQTPGPVCKVPSLDMADVLETEGIAHAHVAPESLRASGIVGTGILLPCGEELGRG